MTGNGSLTTPYIVSTWAEFLSVCSRYGKYIKFADGGGTIDFSQEYPDGINNILTIASSIDGNGWEFKNISFSGQRVYMFCLENSIFNLNFTNIEAHGNNFSLFHIQKNQTTADIGMCYGRFEGCTFQGNLSGNNSQLVGYGTNVLANRNASYKNILWECNFEMKLSGDSVGISCDTKEFKGFAANCVFDIDASAMNNDSYEILSGLMLQNCYIKGSLKGLKLYGDERNDPQKFNEEYWGYQAGYTIVDANSEKSITTDEYTQKIIVNSSKASYGDRIIGVNENQLKDKAFLNSAQINFPIGNGNPQVVYLDRLNYGGINWTTGADYNSKLAVRSDWIPIQPDESGEIIITLKTIKSLVGTRNNGRTWGFVLLRADSSIAIPENNHYRRDCTTVTLGAEYSDCTAIKIELFSGSQPSDYYGFTLYVGRIWQIQKSYNNGFPYTVFMSPEYTPPPKPEPISELQRDYITIYSQETKQDGFDTHGLGVLSPAQCQITEELNGKWDLSIEHPVDSDGKWEYIQPFAIIKALGQLFTIRSVDIRWNGNKGTVSAKADHIFYQLNDPWIYPGNILLSSHHAIGIINHIAGITDRQIREGHIYYDFTWDIPNDLIVTDNFYDNWSNLSSGATFAEFVMGSNGLIVGTNSEIYRDNFYFSINERIENFNDQAFDIRIGKNLKGIKRTIDTTRLCTYFVGFDDLGNEYAIAYDSFPLISPPHYIVRSQKYSYNIDGSLPLDERIAKSQKLLENDVNLFFNINCLPKISYEVDLEDVKNNPDYADFAEESDYRVGNVGYIHDDRLGGEIKLKITKTVKNAITGKTISVTFGDNLEDSSVAASRSAIDDIQIRKEHK